jgi:hypothetical protein
MPKQKVRRKATAPAAAQEFDSVYILKIVLYMIVGSLWVKVTSKTSMKIPIPLGLIAGLLFAAHEHFQIDRKIEYAILLLSMFLGFWLPFGIYIVR